MQRAQAAALVGVGALGALSARGVASPFATLGVALLAGALWLARPAGRVDDRWAWAGLTLAYVALIVSPPLFSDDVYRYLLDGRMSAHGVHPFAYSPDSPKIADLAQDLQPLVNHGHLRTIYPPLAQGLFALNALVGGTLLGWKLLTTGALVGIGRLAAAERPGGAWRVMAHPLALIVVAGNAHVDVFGLLLVVLGLTALRAGGRTRGAAFVGLAASVKLFPLVVLAAWLPRRSGEGASGDRERGDGETTPDAPEDRSGIAQRIVGVFPGLRRGAWAAGIAVGVLALTYVPLGGIGAKTLGSLGTYAETWRFNDGVAGLLTWGTEGVLSAVGAPEVWWSGPGTAFNAWRGNDRLVAGVSHFDMWITRETVGLWVARAVTLLGLGGVTVWAWRRRPSAATVMTAVLLALFITGLVVHPWYAWWAVLLAGWIPSGEATRVRRVADLWGVTVLLAFWAPAAQQVSGAWSDPAWIRALEYVPLFFAAVWGSALFRGDRKKVAE